MVKVLDIRDTCSNIYAVRIQGHVDEDVEMRRDE